MQKRVMCIWLPNWPSQRASVAKRPDNPAPIGPIILARRDSRRGNLVATANQTARAVGVLPHMPLTQCGPLCPEATILPYDPQSDLEALIQLAEALQCFSPIVGLETMDADLWAGRSLAEPQSLLLDVTGIPPLFGGEDQLAANVHQWLFGRGLFACIAIANHVGSAWALANYAHRDTVAKKILRMESGATDASELQSIAISSAETTSGSSAQTTSGQQAFDHLPIESLRLDHATCAKLHRLGIRRNAQLLGLPRDSLTSRFGEILLHRLDALAGQRDEIIHALHASPDLQLDSTFEYPTPNLDDIRHVIENQLTVLCQRLQESSRGAMRIVCRISLEKNAHDLDDFNTQATSGPSQSLASVLQIGLYQPSSDVEHLMMLLQTQLDSQSFRIGGSYWARGVTTQVTLAAPIVWTQESLFDVDSMKHRTEIAKLIDNLSVRLGRDRVLTPVVVPNPLPESAFFWRPMTGWRKDGTSQGTARKLRKPPKRDYQNDPDHFGPSKNDVWRRPTHLFHPIRELSVTEFSSEGPPIIVRYPRANSRVVRSLGPERIESGWWHGAMQRRDYYRLELENGVWLWCYRDLKLQTWHLHGIFD
jgi:protein ImuB